MSDIDDEGVVGAGRPDEGAPPSAGDRTPRRRKARGGTSVGDTLGGIIVGFDQQIMRNLPPPQELVHKAAPVRGVSAADGGRLDIRLPGDEPVDDEPDPDA